MTIPTSADIDDAEDYRTLRDNVIERFNPSDGDGSEISIMTWAVDCAAAYIEAQPCTCTPAVTDPERYDAPCGRCTALGRRGNVREDR